MCLSRRTGPSLESVTAFTFFEGPTVLFVRVRVHVCVCVYARVCVRACVRVSVRFVTGSGRPLAVWVFKGSIFSDHVVPPAYVCMCECTYVCMYVRMYVGM